MKAFLFVVLAATACGKPNDAAILEYEAGTLVKYYQPKLERLDQRVQLIFKRGTTIPANLPGIDEVGKRLGEARDAIIQLRSIIGASTSEKSPVEKQAAALAKENKVEDLEKLVHDTETTLDRGMTVINDNLDAVESWIAQYDRATAQAKAPAAEPPPPPAANPPPPAAPANPTAPKQ